MAHFELPDIQYNPTGWGPFMDCRDLGKDLTHKVVTMPYQPFSKAERLGKVADWMQPYQDRRFTNVGKNMVIPLSGENPYAYFHEEESDSFRLIDTSRIHRGSFQRGRFRMGNRGARGSRFFHGRQNFQTMGGTRGGRVMTRSKWPKHGARGGRYDRGYMHQQQSQRRERDASAQVQSDWIVIEEMDFQRLSKLSLPSVGPGKDIMCCGSLEYYDKSYDRINVKNERTLQRVDRIFHTVTTTDDPIIRKLTKTTGTVYTTDTILCTLMCCTRSNYSWDIVVTKLGDRLFLDKRDNSEFDLLTVNETANDPPYEEGNSPNAPRNLALEATFINHNFSQQVLKMGEERFSFEEPNPFAYDLTESELASIAYRYRSWDLGNGINLVARCEHDAVLKGTGGLKENDVQFITIKALNEWDSSKSTGVDWREKLDKQRGAVLATELRNNTFKLAMWTVQALLAGSQQIKFGYVSRANVRDSTKHVILGTQQFCPGEFAAQINLNMDNAWGILRCILDLCMQQTDGKYLIMKDPNKPLIRLYSIPEDTFESDNEDDEEEDLMEAVGGGKFPG